LNDLHEFKPLLIEIEDKPLNPLGRIILYLVLAIMVFATAWLILAKVDVVVSAQGKVIPSGEIKILKPLESGVVSKIFVKESDKVKKGETLGRIASRYGVSVSQLKKWNGLRSNSVKVGQRLVIRK